MRQRAGLLWPIYLPNARMLVGNHIQHWVRELQRDAAVDSEARQLLLRQLRGAQGLAVS